ncbi:MAG: hypothetical protein IJQ65_06095 [Kiritimatiellae bacterium]|nr:hypothetical protein [Kiritimatiellia bacterium]
MNMLAILAAAAIASDGGLVANWTFDEGRGPIASCAEGKEADGELSAGMKWVTGPFGSALAFSGTNSTVSFAEFPKAVSGAERCTVALWARWNGDGRGKWPSLLSADDWVNGGMMFFVQDGSVSFRMRAKDADGTIRETNGSFLARIPKGKWTHLAVTFDRPALTLYADGKKVASAKWGGRFAEAKRFDLGCGFGKVCHDGFIDDLRFYSRALAPSEVESLANDGVHAEVEGYQDDGTGGVEPVRFHGLDAPVVCTLNGAAASMSIDAVGRISSLVEVGTGRELVKAPVPFVSAAFANGGAARGWKAKSVDGGVVMTCVDGEVEFTVGTFFGGWVFKVVRSTLPPHEKFSFCRVAPDCAKWKGGFVNAWSDELSAVCVRSGDLYGAPQVSHALSVDVDGAWPLVGRTAYLAAGPRGGFRSQLKFMTNAAKAPRSPSGGAWAMDSDVGRRSYLFFNPYPWNLEWGISLARRGGFSNLHFGGWTKTLGHNDPNPKQFPGGLDDMRDYVRRIHDAGLYAGIHTLTACIAQHDPWIRPLCSTNLYAIYSYTLAEPFTEESDEVRVNEKPGPRHSLIATYSTNGNYLRFGSELMQYTGIRREKPYAFTGIKRGVLGTKRGGPYPAGMRVDYPRNHYLAFYPEADSPLADELAARLGNVYRTCGLDEFYFDGSEGMDTRYGTDAMRHKIFRELVKGAPADAKYGPSIEASCNNANNWWFQTRMATTDHGVWGVKRFHDWHVASAIASSRMANFLEPQMGWWQPRLAVKGKVPGHYPDEMEYFASQNAGHDAAMSIQGVWKTPTPFSQKRQLTILGWYERARLARAFSAESLAALKVPGAEFRLRQGADGEWRLAPVACSYHRADHESLMKWRHANAAACAAALRVEALFAVKPYDDAAAMPVLAAADVPNLKADAAEGVKAAVSAGTDVEHGGTIRLAAENGSAAKNGAWARAAKSIGSPYLDIGQAGAFGFWVKGDGSGALLNFVCRGAREYHGGTSDHYVRLDFTGWRYFAVALREREGYAGADYAWPYSSSIHDHLRTIIDTKHVQEFSIYLNDIAPGGSAAVEVSEVRALETFAAEARGLALDVNGARHALPFALESGEFAELEGDVWTRYSEMGDPVERAKAKSPLALNGGENEFALHGSFGCGAPFRASTAVFALGAPKRAFVETLTPEMRRAMAHEFMESIVYAPSKGFDGKATLAVRPGEEANMSIEISGPVKSPALGWRRGAERGGAAFGATVGEGQILVCEDGQSWKVVDAKDWSVVSEGRLAQPLPRFSGTAEIEISSADAANAFAVVDLAKRYAASAAKGAKYRFLAFNIWGDFFKNPVHERDMQQLEIIRSHDPDFVGLQEVTPSFWKSRLISGLAEAGYERVGDEMGPNDEHRVAANPVFFRKARFELVDKGARWFHPELDYSKGVVWAVVRDKATGRKFAVFASHFWWQEKGVADDYLRLLNARMLHETVTQAAKRHGAAVVGGGDLNSPVTSSALSELKKLGWCDAQEKSPETDPRATWRDFPERDASGVYRGVPPEMAKKQMWLDHVFYEPGAVKPLKFSMDRTQKALDVSDHSPVIFDFM